MEAAICRRFPLPPSPIFQPKPLDIHSYQKQCTKQSGFTTISAIGSGKGGGLLEKPTIEKTTPGRESEFDVSYRANWKFHLVMKKSPSAISCRLIGEARALSYGRRGRLV